MVGWRSDNDDGGDGTVRGGRGGGQRLWVAARARACVQRQDRPQRLGGRKAAGWPHPTDGDESGARNPTIWGGGICHKPTC